MKFYLLTILGLSTLLLSCNKKNQVESQQQTTQTFRSKGHELVYKMIQIVGDYSSLSQKKDVVYTYTYQTPDGKTDVSTEKYIFDGELSYGSYDKHQRTFPDLEGNIEQGYDGNEYWLRHNGEVVNDPKRLKRVAFNRPTNFYWFTMFQKLQDPGLNYEYLGEKLVDDMVYDVVKVSFESSEKPTDIYQLYINKSTLLVDQFLFTVADFGRMEEPLLMRVEYEEVDGLLIPTKRHYKGSTWDADVNDEPWINVTWSDVKFNNKLVESDFRI